MVSLPATAMGGDPVTITERDPSLERSLARAGRLYDALEALGELGVADRLRRTYQADVVRHPERRAALRADLVERLGRWLSSAVARGAIVSVEAFVADADDEVDRLL